MSRLLVGVVSADKCDKTITVSVATRKTHPIYKKQYTRTKKFMAHDEANEARVGDRVAIAEVRPLSARKRFVLRQVIEKAPVRHTEAEASESSTPLKQEEVKSVKSPAGKSKTEESKNA